MNRQNLFLLLIIVFNFFSYQVTFSADPSQKKHEIGCLLSRLKKEMAQIYFEIKQCNRMISEFTQRQQSVETAEYIKVKDQLNELYAANLGRKQRLDSILAVLPRSYIDIAVAGAAAGRVGGDSESI